VSSAEARDRGHTLELAALVALCLFLPLYEVPKTLAWLAYLAVWAVNRTRARDAGGAWDLWDSLIVAWLASGVLAAAFAGMHGGEWRGAVDLFRYGSLLWVLRRSRYGTAETRLVLGALLCSTLVGILMAYGALGSGRREALELNSVGHVNHTAIYLAMMFVACAAWAFARWRVLAILAATLLLVALFWTASRAAIGVGLVSLLVLGLAWWRRSHRPLLVSAAAVVLAASVAWVGKAEVINKQQANVEAHNVLSYRDGIWRAALVAWQRYPVFGLGPSNFGRADMEHLRRWREEAGKPFDARLYAHFPHAHSLFLNTLAERGLIGALALAAVLIAWVFYLWRYRPLGSASDEEWILWSAAAGAWLVTVGAGLVNTTLHDEHALLAMLFLGLWLSHRQGSEPPRRR
jgi:O-antigen ligase